MEENEPRTQTQSRPLNLRNNSCISVWLLVIDAKLDCVWLGYIGYF